MLTLQRASAGSGKTYTLTKRYISLLISVVDEGASRPRLRTLPEIADAPSHILGVTFTNKATNEMKARIVLKLSQLAYPDPALPDARIDYLSDFMKEFGTGREEISAVCREALDRLLYDYSDFNISTIDAFFQTILRTFAYESDLPDAYQVIIESDHISRLATQGLIDDVRNGVASPEETHWIDLLVEDQLAGGGKYWNVYEKKSGGKNNAGVFDRISAMARNLDKEEYREARSGFERFQARGVSPLRIYEKIDADLGGRAADLFGLVIGAARMVMDDYGTLASAEGVEISDIIPGKSKTVAPLLRILSPDADTEEIYKIVFKDGTYFCSGTVAKRLAKTNTGDVAPAWDALREALAAHSSFVSSPDFTYWKIFKTGYARFALLGALRGRIEAYLQDNEAMRLNDTNDMIHRIIGSDEVPFIYERLGTYLHHFLIDEFQDTSLMQWKNFKPLLEESESHDYANLIIGDAKQSIYRFRSAEPRLITEIVPADFPGLISRGFAADENANHRSRQSVVRFNNFLFRFLSRDISDRLGELYGNTVQEPRTSEAEPGYVRVEYYPKNDKDSADEQDGEEGGSIPAAIIEKIGNLVTDLLRRGYRQKEIAILVNKKAPGRDIIAGLMEYNRVHRTELAAIGQYLQFVSADSLVLSSSQAVNAVMDCFRIIQDAIEGRTDGSPRKASRRSARWIDIKSDLRAYLSRHPGLTLQGAVKGFLAETEEREGIESVIKEMKAVTLPSLMEILAERFVDGDLRISEAPFLAALQDAILDYCEANPTDIGSMLRWWDSTGRHQSISSSEDTDAINVMTIHKSKGLEFECVILPDLDLNFSRQAEWMWLKVPPTLSYASELPEYMPVKLTDNQAKGTVWEDEINTQTALAVADNLNKAYVAFTRAVSELYVFLPAGENLEFGKAKRLPGMVYPILKESSDRLTSGLDESERHEYAFMPEPGDIAREEEGWVFAYGTPLPDVMENLAKSRKKKQRPTETRSIDTYFVNSDRRNLRFDPEDTPYIFDPADEDRVDMRSEGSLKHAVLELVEVEADLPMAFKKLRSRGRLTRKKIREYEPSLRKALESVRDRGWFSGAYKVYAERPMLMRGEVMKRPDRVMVSPEGDATVVDYKFGTSDNISEHRRQVGEYMGWLREMKRFRDIRGYIWYVNAGEIVEVETEIPFVKGRDRK